MSYSNRSAFRAVLMAASALTLMGAAVPTAFAASQNGLNVETATQVKIAQNDSWKRDRPRNNNRNARNENRRENRADNRRERRNENRAENRRDRRAENRAENRRERRAENRAENRRERRAENRAENRRERRAENRAENRRERRAENRRDRRVENRHRRRNHAHEHRPRHRSHHVRPRHHVRHAPPRYTRPARHARRHYRHRDHHRGYRTSYRSGLGISFHFGSPGYSQFRWAPAAYSFYRPSYGHYSAYQRRTTCRRVTIDGWHHGHRELVSVKQCSNPWDGTYIVQGSERIIACPW